MNCILLGAACTDNAAAKYRGVSQAANNWTHGLLHGIEDAGAKVTAFAHVQDSLWPKGHLFPGATGDLDASVNQILVNYLNFPGCRVASLKNGLVEAVENHIARSGLPDAFLTYNLYPHYVAAAREIQRRHRIPWVPIILDLDDPERDDWSSFKDSSRGADGYVFLSWWGYCNADVELKLHLDSGASSQFASSPHRRNSVRTVVYAGNFSGFSGTELLIEVIRKIPEKDVQFIICGKGVIAPLEELARLDSRVLVKGFVSDSELAEICRSADIFINPRPLTYQENKMVFPSKLLFYLSFGCPVVSTWTPGIAPEFREVLVAPEAGDATSLARSVSHVLSWSDDKLDAYRTKLSSFLENRSWAHQGDKLVQFLGHVIKSSVQEPQL